MKTLTVDEIMSWKPCEDYPRSRIVELFSGRDQITPVDVLKMDIPHLDKLWAVLRSEIFRDIDLQFMACDFVESILDLLPNDDCQLISSALNRKRESIRGGGIIDQQEFNNKFRFRLDTIIRTTFNIAIRRVWMACIAALSGVNIIACATHAFNAKEDLSEQEKQIAIILKYLEKG